MTFTPIRLVARAKVNLCLHVTGRRRDGYHLLDSLTAFTDLGDIITIAPSETKTSLQITSSGLPATAPDVPATVDNLAWRALAMVAKRAVGPAPGLTLSIEKQIPSGAGLGGGSSDAAAVLEAANALMKTGLVVEDLANMGLNLGADIPVCLQESCTRVQGIGENLSPVSLPHALPIVLIWPGQAVATADVFRGPGNIVGEPLNNEFFQHLNREPFNALRDLRNDLTDRAVRICPAIGEAITALRGSDGCEVSRMTGSGSAVFGLFTSLEHAATAAAILAKRYPNWWVRASSLR